MESNDLTMRVLVEIRDDIRAMKDEVRSTNVRVEHLESKLETGLRDMSDRIVESEIRTATAIVDMHGTLRDVATSLKRSDGLRERVDWCEREIELLKRRPG